MTVYDKKYMKMPNYYAKKREVLHRFEITEKIDGANFRWVLTHDTINRPKIVFGSREHMNIMYSIYNPKTNEWALYDPTGAKLGKTGYKKSFKGYASFVSDKLFAHDLKKYNELAYKYQDYVFFGECVGNHKIQYEHDPDRLVVGFAIYNVKTELWDARWKYAMDDIGIPKVPILNDYVDFKDKSPDEIWSLIQDEEWVKKQKSWYDGSSITEGVVLADYKHQTFFKLKTKKFLSTNAPKQRVSSWDQLVNKYVTKQRIEKMILKAKNEEIGYNKKNPIPSLGGRLTAEITEEAVDDIMKIIRNKLVGLVTKKIADYPNLFNEILSLVEE